jgi:WD40-like Beta Propeller Repeat
MTYRSPPTPPGWTALAVLASLLAGCSHSKPFAEREGSTAPFDPSPPIRLTLNPGHDGEPSWLPDGSGILYSARQPDRDDGDTCLAELPGTGGGQRRLVCDVPGDRETTDALQAPAAAPDGRLALLTAGNGTIGGNTPVFLGIALAPTLDASDAQTVRRLPFSPPGGLFQDYAGYLHWIDDRVIYVGQRFWAVLRCPDRGCPLDTLITGTEVSILDPAAPDQLTFIPGTREATGMIPIEDGTAILFTLPSDSRVYRRSLDGGEVSVVHDFGAAGIARDVHVAGTRLAAVVGGRIAYGNDPRIGGAVQWDSGGVLHIVDLDGGAEVVFDTPDRLYRRPAVSPDGSRVVVESFPLIVSPGLADTTVSRIADLYLFGGE